MWIKTPCIGLLLVLGCQGRQVNVDLAVSFHHQDGEVKVTVRN